MAASKATLGYLGVFSIVNSASPPVPVPMLEVKSIKMALLTVPVVIATHLTSPNATEEKRPGLIMPGSLDIVANFIGDATQLNILTLAEGRTTFSFTVTRPVNNGTQVYTLSGSGFIASYDPGDVEPSKLGELTMKMELAGALTEAVV